ncbi:MAG TPA: PAS domain S-box protein, partial [Holophaga sp.]|nr:PAS domain S-box protein [Holophaga sp.]
MKRLLSQPARRAVMIILAFLGFSLLWIPLTDRLLGWMVQDPATLTRLATYKRFIYLGLSSLLLFLLILSALRLPKEDAAEHPYPRMNHEGFKTLSLLFVLATLVVGLVALGAYRFQQASLERAAGAELTYLARVQRDRFEAWLDERLNDATATATGLPRPRGEASVAQIRDRFLVLKQTYGYRTIRLLDREGRVLVSTDPGAPAPLEQAAARETGPHDAPRLVWELEGASARLLAVAPTGPGQEGEPQGVLVLGLDLDGFLAHLLREQPSYRASVETHLACRQAQALHWLSPPGFPDHGRPSVDLSRTELLGIRVWTQGDGVQQGPDYRGVPSIAATQRIARLPWVLYTKMDHSEAIAPLVRLGWAYVCLGGLVLGLFGALLLVWWSRERTRAARLARERELLSMRLQSLSRNANDIVLLLDEDGGLLDANDRAASAYGYRLEELRTMRIRDLRTLDALGDFSEQFQLAKEQESVRFETMHVRKDGSFFPVEVSSRAFQMEGRIYVQSIIRDITERKASEELLKNSEERFRRLFEDAAEGLALLDCATGTLSDCNLAFQRMVGQDRQALVGASLERIVPRASVELLNQKLASILASGDGSGEMESRLLIASGEERDVLVQARVIRIQERPFLQAMFTDLTEARRRERERDATVRLLSLLNEPVSRTHELIALLTEFLQEWTGCEAVGIRLKEHEDYPYFETRGFPPAFVEAESHLCARDHAGALLRDGSGNPVMECMCGNILCRRFNPSLPFFTPRGSFWTNSTTHLLASTTEEDRQNRTRNRCNGEGYESVALIPMISGEEVLGLMQLNDPAPGRFSRELIEFLEQAARQIALALAQRRAQE